VTKRKGRSRKDPTATLSQQVNDWFEQLALCEIERLPTAAWEDLIVWRWLPKAFPATRKRILARFLSVAQKRGEALSARFVRRFAGHACREIGAKPIQTAVRDQTGFQAAARYRARHPGASWNDLAKATSVKKSTLRQWRGRADFEKHIEDEKARLELNRPLINMARRLRQWRQEST
jgi:hypothetical protein